MACKKLKKRNRQLSEQLIELEKDYYNLQEAKVKVEAHLETLYDQLKQEETERKDLTRVILPLQEAITLIERHSRASEASGAQQTLKRINNLMCDQAKTPTVVRTRNRPESMLSVLSDGDTSSIAESYTIEEGTRSNAFISEKNRAVLDIRVAGKTMPGVSSVRHVSTTSTLETVAKAGQSGTPAQTSPDIIEGSSSKLIAKSQHVETKTESVKEAPLSHVRSDSSPSTSNSRIAQNSNTLPAKKTRHLSVSSSGVEKSTKRNRSQSFKYDYKVRDQANSGPSGPQLCLQNKELQNKLDKQRKKIESYSESSEGSEYQNQ